MSRFIWVRDSDKNDHYINIDHISRVTRVPGRAGDDSYSFIIVESTPGARVIKLSNDIFDTFDDVISKIQVASA